MNADEAGDFLDRVEDLQLGRVEGLDHGAKLEALVDLTVALERGIQNGYRALNDGTTPERFDVLGVDRLDALTVLRAGPIAGYTFTVQCLLRGGT